MSTRDRRDDQDHDADADRDAPRWTRAELALLRRAGWQRWAVPDALQTEVLHQLGRILARGTDREKPSAARTLAVLDRDIIAAIWAVPSFRAGVLATIINLRRAIPREPPLPGLSAHLGRISRDCSIVTGRF